MMSIATEKLIFRKMTLDDLPQLMLIEQDSFSTPWTEDAFRNELKNNMFAQYMAVEFEEEVIGYGGMWIIVDEAHITNIALHSKYRGLGIGNILMQELQRTAAYLGAVRMTLEVRVGNEVAQQLYRKFGFVEAGLRPNYYADTNEDALIMWADLPQEDNGGKQDE